MKLVIVNGIPEVKETQSNMVFKVNGVQIHGVSQLICQDNIISKAWEGADAVLHQVPIRYRRQVTWGFDAQHVDEFTKLYKLIMNQILGSGHNVNFDIVTPYMGELNVSMHAYFGSPFKSEVIYSNDTGIQRCKHEIVFTEPVGTKLKDVTENE